VLDRTPRATVARSDAAATEMRTRHCAIGTEARVVALDARGAGRLLSVVPVFGRARMQCAGRASATIRERAVASEVCPWERSASCSAWLASSGADSLPRSRPLHVHGDELHRTGRPQGERRLRRAAHAREARRKPDRPGADAAHRAPDEAVSAQCRRAQGPCSPRTSPGRRAPSSSSLAPENCAATSRRGSGGPRAS